MDICWGVPPPSNSGRALQRAFRAESSPTFPSEGNPLLKILVTGILGKGTSLRHIYQLGGGTKIVKRSKQSEKETFNSATFGAMSGNH